MATFNGTNGDDTIIGTSGNDTINGRRGNDSLVGGGGHDFIEGGWDDDTLFGNDGNDTLRGEADNDVLHGGNGDDRLDGGSGQDTLFGGEGNDELLGVSGEDSLDGGAGNDTVDGGSGDDTVNGGAGNDTVRGGSGHDLIDGGSGNDSIEGGSGHDTITGGTGSDTINGGSGHDQVIFSGSITDYTIALGASAATVAGADGTDTIAEVETLVFDDYVLDLTGGNNAPVAFDDAVSGDEDTQITGNVLDDNGNGADFDFEGDTLSVVAAMITTSNGGTVMLNADGSFTYDPAANFHGTDSFEYTVTDGTLTDTATVTLTVNPVNDAPVAADDAFAGDEDTQITGSVLLDNGNGADSDVDGDTLSVVPASFVTAGGGTVNILADGSFTYDPALNYHGPDSFTYTLSDGTLTDTGTVTLTVNPVNDAPVANPDSATTAEDTAVTINVLANDSDVDGDTLTVTSFTQGEFGSVVETSPGVFSYTPAPGFVGTDAFTYIVSDGNGGVASTSVTVTVGGTGENTAPIARTASIAATVEDIGPNILTINFNTLTVNGQPIISDAEQTLGELDITDVRLTNDRLNLDFTETSAGSNIFTLDLDGLELADGAFRNLQIAYTVDDGQGAANSAASGVINLTVTNPDNGPTNTAPVAGDDTITQTEADGTITINMAAAGGLAMDADGNPLTVTSISFTDEFGNPLAFDPLELSGTEESGGVVSFDPNVFGLGDGVSGTFLMSYTVSDGTASDTGVVTLALTGSADNAPPVTNDTPLVRSLPADLSLDGYLYFDLGLLVSDPDGDPLTISFVSITDPVTGNPIPVTGVDVGGDGIVTGLLEGNFLRILGAELDLEAGESLDLEINYQVSDGINPPVDGNLEVTVDGPPTGPTGEVIEDFESYSVDGGFSMVLDDIGGLSFEGTANVFEVDEMGARAAAGLLNGQTTTGGDNAAVIQGSYIGDDTGGLPEYAFTLLGAGNTLGVPDGPVTVIDPATLGQAFDLESMSLTALTGPATTVTIVPYRLVEINVGPAGNGDYEFVAVGEFEVDVSSAAATLLDFTSGDFAGFDDPNTAEVETSALENIVALQIVTTGSINDTNGENPGGEVPVFDDPLVIDDLVFAF